MDDFTQEDHDWFERVKENPSLYHIIIDEDSVFIESDSEDGDPCIYTFSCYGCNFIHALLNDMGIRAGY